MARKNLLKGFQRPKKLETFEHIEVESNDYGKFAAAPFEPGFGTTVGNTLRRVLLSSIQGYAVTSVHIVSYNAEGVPHTISSEFEKIPNVSEDTLEILNSLKQLRLRLPDGNEQDTLFYEFKGPGKVTSGDLAKGGQLEVMSKDVPLFTMMDDAHLEIEIQVDLGRGYVSSETNSNYIEVAGTIPLDAMFSPVKKVKFYIEPCRVGQRNDYDKLFLEIWTDGTILPVDSLAEAAKIAKEHFSVFINFDDTLSALDDDFDENDEQIRALLSTPVEELELSVRSSNCLKNANIRTIGELTRKTEDDIAKTRNFGKKSLTEIKEKLLEWNLTLGMTDYSYLKDTVNLNKKKEETDES